MVILTTRKNLDHWLMRSMVQIDRDIKGIAKEVKGRSVKLLKGLVKDDVSMTSSMSHVAR